MARKLPSKARARLHRFALAAAVLVAAAVYLTVPLTGRVPIALATLATGAAVYAAASLAVRKAYAALWGATRRPAPRKAAP